VDETYYNTCSTSDLARILADCRITVSPLNPGFDLGNLLSEIRDCKIVKGNNRRQVYHLQTPGGGCFLKRSCLIRTKDRLRHFFLPRRRWAEWRNLHHLWHSRIPAARPLAKGEFPKNIHPRSYFILTEQVPGTHIPFNSAAHAGSLGGYAARLHQHGVFHADLNRKNFILNPAGEFYLLDTQEVYFLPWMPHRLRVNNLGRIIFNHCSPDDSASWVATFLEEYNRSYSKNISLSEAINAARRQQQRRYRSRSKRCCKNSSQFEILKNRQLHGFKRRGFDWGAPELQQAEANGKLLKGTHVFSYHGVCIKKQRQRFFHQNRCLASWKMSQALEARGIAVPRSLGYLVLNGRNFFLSELLDDSLHLNDYLSMINDEQAKRRQLIKLAFWVKKIHDAHVWQRDFKSKNILCRRGHYYMIDLDGVRIRCLTERDRITNLSQLNASLSNAITIRDRLRFFDYYFAGEKSSRHQRRLVYRKIWDISRTKGTANYNLDLKKFDLCH
jgi:tRNA A-37 threonylcarbamoyl transferase component Bud32